MKRVASVSWLRVAAAARLGAARSARHAPALLPRLARASPAAVSLTPVHITGSGVNEGRARFSASPPSSAAALGAGLASDNLAAFAPRSIKVDSGKYMRPTTDWTDVAAIDETVLLEFLSISKLFSHKPKGVNLLREEGVPMAALAEVFARRIAGKVRQGADTKGSGGRACVWPLPSPSAPPCPPMQAQPVPCRCPPHSHVCPSPLPAVPSPPCSSLRRHPAPAVPRGGSCRAHRRALTQSSLPLRAAPSTAAR